MKKMIFVMLMAMSSSSFANTAECAQVLDTMTKLTYTYIDVLNSCKKLENEGATDSHFYEGYRRIARSAEENHRKGSDICYRVCADTFFCDGELSGACTK